MGVFRSATVGLLLALTLTACGSAAEELSEKAIESATGGDVEIDNDGESVKIKTEDGTYEASSGKSVKMPAEFPAGVPLPKGMKLTSAATMGEVYSLGYEGSESEVEKACETLRADMKSAGFEEDLWADNGGDVVAGVSKGSLAANWTCSPSSKQVSLIVTTAN